MNLLIRYEHKEQLFHEKVIFKVSFEESIFNSIRAQASHNVSEWITISSFGPDRRIFTFIRRSWMEILGAFVYTI